MVFRLSVYRVRQTTQAKSIETVQVKIEVQNQQQPLYLERIQYEKIIFNCEIPKIPLLEGVESGSGKVSYVKVGQAIHH